MEAPLQQRIVGAIVLVTLGVIFIPALLDGSGYKSRQVQDIEVKEKPEFTPLKNNRVGTVPTPLDKTRGQQASDKKMASETKEPIKSATNKASTEQAKKKKPIKSFALQVGTFDENDRAIVMRDKLRKAGYTTYVYKSTVNGKTRYKVRIGPELEYSALEKVKKKIKKSHKIDAFIVNHP